MGFGSWYRRRSRKGPVFDGGMVNGEWWWDDGMMGNDRDCTHGASQAGSDSTVATWWGCCLDFLILIIPQVSFPPSSNSGWGLRIGRKERKDSFGATTMLRTVPPGAVTGNGNGDGYGYGHGKGMGMYVCMYVLRMCLCVSRVLLVLKVLYFGKHVAFTIVYSIVCSF